MKFGLFGIGSGLCADPDIARRVAEVAEHREFESLWTGEHVVLPQPRVPPSPAPSDFPMLHPSAALAFLAACTDRIRLGTGIVLIAQRNPLVLAKEMASLDVLCDGRLLLGIGAGYLKSEFDALGVPFAERGSRTDEYVDVMRTLWNEAQPEFHGRYYDFTGVQAYPRPRQKGGPPLIVGGTSRAALCRTLRIGQGWYGFALDVDQAADCVRRLQKLATTMQRPPALGELEISITPLLPLTPARVEAYGEAGVHRLIPLIPQDSEQHVMDFMESMADELMQP